MTHQPYGGVGGQAEDIRIQAEQIIKSKMELIRIIARHTGQPEDIVRKDSERDKYFNAMRPRNTVSWMRSSPSFPRTCLDNEALGTRHRALVRSRQATPEVFPALTSA